jgi:hypothetical protein
MTKLDQNQTNEQAPKTDQESVLDEWIKERDSFPKGSPEWLEHNNVIQAYLYEMDKTTELVNAETTDNSSALAIAKAGISSTVEFNPVGGIPMGKENSRNGAVATPAELEELRRHAEL